MSILNEELSEELKNKDKEVHALQQQLEALKSLYKDTKISLEAPKKKTQSSSQEKERAKKRIDKLMAALAETERKVHGQQQELKKMQAIENELQKEKEAKLNALEEIAALRRQLELLKKKIASNQSTLKAQQEQIKTLTEVKNKGLEIPLENLSIEESQQKSFGMTS